MNKENLSNSTPLTDNFDNTLLGDSKNHNPKIKYPIGGFAPGNYMCKCITCSDEFFGDKRAVQCEPCAINAVNESNSKALLELHRLKSAIFDIKKSYDKINELLG